MKRLIKCFFSVWIVFSTGVYADELSSQLDALAVAEPTERNPVSVSAMVWPEAANPGDVVTVALKVKIQPGWRIYRYVPATAPYMATKWPIDVADGLSLEGDWQKPAPEYLPGYSDILIDQGELVFVHAVKVGESAEKGSSLAIKAGLDYQTCNEEMCLRPTKKIIDLLVSVR